MSDDPSDGDPFDTGAVRQRVLAGWRAAAVRFREDANAEEDLALGGYRDRLVVELAQNAADAAARAGVDGRLLLRLTDLEDGPVLVAANTGAALDDAGVEALSTLRASAKRGDASTVGRFGVGFAAVLGVSDEPAVLSRHGGVRFSAADTRDLVTHAAAGTPALAEELARRDGHVPVLRLPFPAEGTPPEGYDTAVVLPLRDAVAEDLVVRLLDEVGDALLVALPALAEVMLELPGREPRTVRDVAARWHVVRRSGRFADALLADRPTEERARTAWSLTWALPAAGSALPSPASHRDGPATGSLLMAEQAGGGSLLMAEQSTAPRTQVLHAPTPSDEPLPWPALLVGTFPLDPSRRHVAPGPATDALVREAAAGYADLLTEVAAAGRTPWDLVPVGLPAGVLDGALRSALADLLPGTAFLVAAEQPEPGPDGAPPAVLRPRDAVALDPPAGADAAVVVALAPTVAGLVLVPRAARAAADLVGVRRVE
ncbi:sacsin N-terminal ATP-binding-like domain-containing protein, partial [Kineosporia sp. A_224]|uniref:sacsin N-terminal ATP-binding-like domain-containing protein n=1 Tax=Kineosporia sp. A_224 TaxID=1962180 RepID=UPI001E3FBF7D